MWIGQVQSREVRAVDVSTDFERQLDETCERLKLHVNHSLGVGRIWLIPGQQYCCDNPSIGASGCYVSGVGVFERNRVLHVTQEWSDRETLNAKHLGCLFPGHYSFRNVQRELLVVTEVSINSDLTRSKVISMVGEPSLA